MSDKIIALDKDFNKMLNDNAEAAWLEYCRARGLDPNEESEQNEADENI